MVLVLWTKNEVPASAHPNYTFVPHSPMRPRHTPPRRRLGFLRSGFTWYLYYGGILVQVRVHSTYVPIRRNSVKTRIKQPHTRAHDGPLESVSHLVICLSLPGRVCTSTRASPASNAYLHRTVFTASTYDKASQQSTHTNSVASLQVINFSRHSAAK